MKSTLAVNMMCLALVSGCSTHHWAGIEQTQLSPPKGQPILHTTRVIVAVSENTNETQCVVYEKYHPICFYNIKPALEAGLARSLWPSFPEIVVGKASSAGPSDYVLQVELSLDALPPDGEGPGWSAGARGRFRLLRGSAVLAEETTAARSRSHFAYGAPLGEGATEVVDATIAHIAQAAFAVEESRIIAPPLLPQVASQAFAPKSAALPVQLAGTGTNITNSPSLAKSTLE